MVAAAAAMAPFADHASVFHDDRTDGRIGARMPRAPSGQGDCTPHVVGVRHGVNVSSSGGSCFRAARTFFANLSSTPFTNRPLFDSENHYARSTASLTTIGDGISAQFWSSHAARRSTARSTVPRR